MDIHSNYHFFQIFRCVFYHRHEGSLFCFLWIFFLWDVFSRHLSKATPEYHWLSQI